MEKGKSYVFYNNKYHFGRDEDKVYVGKLIDFMKNEPDVMVFQLPEGGMRFSTNAHSEINQLCNSHEFIEYVAENFQNRFQRNVSVWHENYEFKVSIPREYTENDVSLNLIELTMDDTLEDWWSVQWRELRYNNIQCKRDEIIVSFRIHDVHEVEFRYNDAEGK